MAQETSTATTIVTKWLLDTRALWRGDNIRDAVSFVIFSFTYSSVYREASDACLKASEYLALLPSEEQKVVLRKYHFADACMALGSALLKRAYISHCTGLDWPKIKLSRRLDAQLGKPCWVAPEDGNEWPTIEFNVSHQRGIVVLIGACTTISGNGNIVSDVDVSVDVVSPNERNDMASIAATNFSDFISTFEYVLSEEEIFGITYTLPTNGTIKLLSGEEISNESLGRLDRTIECGQGLKARLKDGREVTVPSELIIEEKMRNFYATFSMKEAFTKLGGLGLSAPWIKQCEFIGVRAPAKGGVRRCNILGAWGEIIRGDKDDISVDGNLGGVASEQQALEEDYIITTMLRPSSALSGGEFPAWITVHLENILP
jgi:4'-phosphopantetheinyl transferase